MKAEIYRVSDLVMACATPPLTAEVILRADGLPRDAKVAHIMPVGKDYWEILVTSDHYADKSIHQLATDSSGCLHYSKETIEELRKDHQNGLQSEGD